MYTWNVSFNFHYLAVATYYFRACGPMYRHFNLVAYPAAICPGCESGH
jgi:hypothetical protein